jgi:hypothetical protein
VESRQGALDAGRSHAWRARRPRQARGGARDLPSDRPRHDHRGQRDHREEGRRGVGAHHRRLRRLSRDPADEPNDALRHQDPQAAVALLDHPIQNRILRNTPRVRPPEGHAATDAGRRTMCTRGRARAPSSRRRHLAGAWCEASRPATRTRHLPREPGIAPAGRRLPRAAPRWQFPRAWRQRLPRQASRRSAGMPSHGARSKPATLAPRRPR